MKPTISLLLVAFAALTLNAQTRSITATDYDGAFQRAVSGTNGAFPFVYTVVTETYEGGKPVSTEKEVDERQAEGVERDTKTLNAGGKTLRSYSITLGFDNNTYCSRDGKAWKGPQRFICPGPDGSVVAELNTPREPERVEYSVMEKSIDGQPIKVYRKYAIYAASEPNGKKSFEEQLATIDSRGFFISVTDNEGTLEPKTVTLIRKETWDFKTKFNPVVAPKQP